MLSLERIKEMRDRLDKAAPGPWDVKHCKPCDVSSIFDLNGENILWSHHIADGDREGAANSEDAAFIANARQDLPDALAEIERLKKQCNVLTRVIEVMRPESESESEWSLPYPEVWEEGSVER